LQTASGLLNTCANVSPGGARNVAASIRDAVAQLREHPLSGHQTDDPAIRVLFIVHHPYKIFYRVGETVEILHIRHTSRRENR
jgi:plasmid stabilization system protein ParE